MKGSVGKSSLVVLRTSVFRLLSAFLAFALMLATLNGCGTIAGKETLESPGKESVAGSEKDSLTVIRLRPLQDIGNELFAYICSDYTSYHQFVSDPENFPFDKTFKKPAPSFGDISFEAAQETALYYRSLLDELEGYTFSALNKDEQRLYRYLTYNLKSSLDLEPYFYLTDPYEPSYGVQTMLPLTLMVYSFRTRQDIDDYLSLVADVPHILDQANTITRERAARGLFPNLAAVEATIEEAEVYTAGTSYNLLVTSFEDALNSGSFPFADLTDAERVSYRETNRAIVETKVVPAYKDAIALLKEVAKKTSYDVTLASQPDGADYYAARMRAKGFYQSPTQAIKALDDVLDSLIEVFIRNDVLYDPDMLNRIVSRNIPADATETIKYFNSRIGEDFPDIGIRPFVVDSASDDEVIKNVAAFYLIAPVDDLTDNLIKYYPQNIHDRYRLGLTLAHESFPGHLYQYNYFGLSGPQPIEILLGNTAYEEGYAVYSEYFGIRYMGFDEEMAEVLFADELFGRALQARIDLGVNYEGWSLAETKSFLADWGMDFYATELFRGTAASPLSILPYGLGPLEFCAMLSTAQSTLGSAFDSKEFHATILKNGAVPLILLKKDFSVWVYEHRFDRGRV